MKTGHGTADNRHCAVGDQPRLISPHQHHLFRATAKREPMTENATNEKPATPPARPIAEDFSKEIEQSMERQTHELIKVVRVFDNCYRCNWWAPDRSAGSFWLATGKIRKSMLVRATKSTDGLLIEDVTKFPTEE
jgi:hypothetical protein